jgi:uncharacterized protein YbaP (TraB family)
MGLASLWASLQRMRAALFVFALIVGGLNAWAAESHDPKPAQWAHISPKVCPPTAHAPSAEALQTIAAKAQDRGFLWRIDKDGRTSYLYGTLHVGRLNWLVPGERTRAALQASDTVAVELDMSNPDTVRQVQQRLSKSGGKPPSADLMRRLKVQLKRACLPETLTHTLSPELLASMLVVMSAREAGLDPAYGIDPVLASMGRSLGKSVISLESVETQARALRQVTSSPGANGLEGLLHSVETGQAAPLLEKMARVWSHSQFDELDRYEQWCDCMNTRAERETVRQLLDQRNPAMARRIAGLHDGGQRVFAAVGSLHLFGAKGLPRLLQQRGFQVQRLEWPAARDDSETSATSPKPPQPAQSEDNGGSRSSAPAQ